MTATIIDSSTQEEQTDDQFSDITEEADKGTQTPADQTTEETTENVDVPEKYQGKTPAELIRMHQEAELLLGRHSSEVGELRKTVDTFIQGQASQSGNGNSTEETEEEIDFFADPAKAVNKLVETHPAIAEAKKTSAAASRESARLALKEKHPDMATVLSDPKFSEWVHKSTVRVNMLLKADQEYDVDSANELLSTWKELQGVVQQTQEQAEAERKETLKKGNTGKASGTSTTTPKKIYRRADIIKLMQTDRKRYDALQPEIMKAYEEGRVK